MNLTFHPVTPDRWDDFEKLFGKNGACGGCWCMSFRLRRKDFDANKGEPHKQAMKAIIESGEMPGLLAYDGAEPIGWAAVSPRDVFVRLETSRTLKNIDGRPVWSIPCFFVAKRYRRQGVTTALLNAAVEFVRQQGGEVLEGYPNVPSQELPPPFLWTGVQSAFLKAGFTEVARPSQSKAIMRKNTTHHE
ncbi:MAG TPA: GNAT family N-acetyltransferase [Symbiobacteriaceae bacterium]|nr:GNAT family N-acetyltransferase [Symbiobacteriaceae bacterium]